MVHEVVKYVFNLAQNSILFQGPVPVLKTVFDSDGSKDFNEGMMHRGVSKVMTPTRDAELCRD